MRGEAGYTLIELLVVVAMIAILTAVSTEYLAQQPAQLSSAIQQFTLKLEETRALALANAGQLNVGDGTHAAAATGATLWIHPDQKDPAYSIATLYWYRPIVQNPCNGCVQIDGTSEPLRTRVSLTATIPGYGSSDSFAIFISPSGNVSATTIETWFPGHAPLTAEPACDPNDLPALTFQSQMHIQTRHLACSGGAIN
jgi:prepilin-type N-terminal cleavage/methylation domain-containing protein